MANITGECIDNLSLLYVNSAKSFNLAQLDCERQSGNLVVPINVNVLTRIQDLIINESTDTEEPTWVGLIDSNDIGGSGDTSRFLSVVDDIAPEFTNLGQISENGENFPWLDSQPNDFGSFQNCIGVEQSELADFNCENNQEYICQFVCPNEENIEEDELDFEVLVGVGVSGVCFLLLAFVCCCILFKNCSKTKEKNILEENSTLKKLEDDYDIPMTERRDDTISIFRPSSWYTKNKQKRQTSIDEEI